ncbi:YopX family protein [Lysinibacillus fusiformis]|uniref:YopX protein domain-containing protein n=1 Tax=Lysinibacillus fusiformis TaxID=28031 RepID=A0A1E4R4Q3_9BACI|nr:YopX family protein [Lysinibacillus fusiformis]ODV55444.1 hypothetical protein BG258_05770 [Lysinibacillus fusiformis]
MSREIKFRAWDELEKRMWTLDDAGEDSGDGSIQYFSENGSLEFGRLEYYDTGLGVNSHFEKFPLMQYTGLKDKDGKEIYEGDIIRFTNGIDEVYEEVGTVVFDLEECGYKAQYTDDGVTHCIYLINPKVFADKYTEITYEIIGNIYENPELLEGAA